MNVLLCIRISSMSMPSTPGDQKQQDPTKLELQMVGSHHTGTVNSSPGPLQKQFSNPNNKSRGQGDFGPGDLGLIWNPSTLRLREKNHNFVANYDYLGNPGVQC